MITIDLRQLPPEGKEITGQAESDVFQFAQKDTARAASPLTYRLTVHHVGEFLQVEGQIEATFSLECGRCAERFQQSIKIPNYEAEIPVENRDIIDLTPSLREDILLDLPGYPRCENGNVDPRECPAKDEFEIRDSEDDQSGSTSDESERKDVWGALDDIDINPK